MKAKLAKRLILFNLVGASVQTAALGIMLND